MKQPSQNPTSLRYFVHPAMEVSIKDIIVASFHMRIFGQPQVYFWQSA